MLSVYFCNNHSVIPVVIFQPTISLGIKKNIGTLGNVSHGKTTFIYSVTGIRTNKFKNELLQNITVKLGYCDCFILKRHGNFLSSYITTNKSLNVTKYYLFTNRISFIDCPGHDLLLSTMLGGISVANGVLFFIDSSSYFQKKQTFEHIKALVLSPIKKVVIIQTKIDLADTNKIMYQYIQLKNFFYSLKGFRFQFFPFSFLLPLHLSPILKKICKLFNNSMERRYKEFDTVIIRSFNINKPGRNTRDILGGVIGVCIISGNISINKNIEIRPGIVNYEKLTYKPIITKFSNISDMVYKYNSVIPGGLLSLKTNISYQYSKGDLLVGNTMGCIGNLPHVYGYLKIKYKILQKLYYSENRHIIHHSNELTVTKNEILLIHYNSTSANCLVIKVIVFQKKSKSAILLKLYTPLCCNMNKKIAISKLINNKWNLLGWAVTNSGITLEQE
uniref:protein-synthesizing GTPase n=1 Tax=Amorphochlora amoebiformis TaxID=1561963 RepID=A0A0H5BHY0_9EUKA|nr:eukaryotic translation initiation factor gamma SU [Amorphochlora amoebiformis]